jgi:hypothetical protein
MKTREKYRSGISQIPHSYQPGIGTLMAKGVCVVGLVNLPNLISKMLKQLGGHSREPYIRQGEEVIYALYPTVTLYVLAVGLSR